MNLSPGARLGPYEIVSPLGAGGMGEVYRARDPRLEREVALKILGRDLLADESARRRFRKEALALAKLNHPHIAHVYDFASEGEVDFLVMELVPGEMLSERLARGPLSEGDVLKVGKELAEGLAAAHAEGVIHCDLKPANLRLSKQGVLKILDFGLAQLRQPAVTNLATLTGTEIGVSGTLPYMAPEQLRAETLDARTDLWGAGAVLYELATGVHPFREAVPAKLTDAILHADPEPPAARRPEISAGLSDIVLKCLEKNPDRRYQSANDLRLDLERMASPTVSTAATSERPSSSGWFFAAAAAAVVVLGVFLFLRWVPSGRSPATALPKPGATRSPLRSIAVLPFVNMSGSKENEYLGDGISEEVINVLAKDGHLQVVSRTSAFAFKGQNLDAREIGKKLSADAILEGSIRQAGSRLRVTAQLIDAANGYHLWSQTFDREASDIFAIQDEISRTIVAKLEPSAAKSGGAGAPPTANLEAYDLFLRGRYAMSGWERDGLRAAEGHFEKAVRLDPDFGAAWAALAETVIMQHEIYGIRERDEAYAKASDAAHRALAVSKPAGEGHAALAHILGHHGKWKAAEEEARLAVQANPGATTGHEWLGWILWMTGRFSDAEREFRRALELDPLSGPSHASFGGCLVSEGRYAEALPQIERGIELGFGMSWSYSIKIVALVQLKRFDDALAFLDQLPGGPESGPTLEILRAYVHAAAGRKTEAAAILSKVEKRSPSVEGDDATLVALAYATSGDRDAAIEWFRKAGHRVYEMLGFMRFLPEVRPLLSDPRMQPLLRSAGYID